jgi:hypothetical protein
VTGVGAADSKVALYEDAEGDRGVIAMEVRHQQHPPSSNSQPCETTVHLLWQACEARVCMYYTHVWRSRCVISNSSCQVCLTFHSFRVCVMLQVFNGQAPHMGLCLQGIPAGTQCP